SSDLDVAAVDVIAERGAILLGDGRAKLDRQVRDAARRVEDAGIHERTGRAGIEAATTGAALLERLRIGLEIERGDDLGEKQPRPVLGVDQARVLANPAEARILRVDALLHRAGIDVPA